MTERKSRTREGSGKDAGMGKEEMEREGPQIREEWSQPARDGQDGETEKGVWEREETATQW